MLAFVFCSLSLCVVVASTGAEQAPGSANTERPHYLGLKPGLGGGYSARKGSVTTFALLP